MSYLLRDGKVITKAIEYSVSCHCNLRCSSCSHMSPFLEKKDPSPESFLSDVTQLSKGLHASIIRLIGGEPLLNAEIVAFLSIAKKSGIADSVMVTTNGLLLHLMKDEFWELVDIVLVNLYPGIRMREKRNVLRDRAKEFNTRLFVQAPSTFRTTIVTSPHPKDWLTGMIFRTCKNVHLYHCHMIHEGKLYKCAVPPFLPEYLTKIGIRDYDPKKDAFDIHKTTNIFSELKRYLLSLETMEACRFCLGYMGKPRHHHQLEPEFIRNPRLQNITRSEHLDLNKALKECAGYYRRKTLSKLGRKQVW